MGQNGNHVVHGEQVLWCEYLTALEIAEIEAHIASLRRAWKVPDENDLVENRGSQVSYSIYGHHAPVPIKEAFDPNQAKRRTLLAEHPLHSNTIEVKIAGTTCLDYFRKGCNKGHNVARLIEHEGWAKDDCIYFGDAIYPGGNDETVYGVIETQGVQNPQDTYEKLTALR
jgi:HAD superfamily hydrolase (TIGR01484 family)